MQRKDEEIIVYHQREQASKKREADLHRELKVQKEKNRKFQHELESNAREQISRENKISFIHQKLGELLPDPKAEYVEENEEIGLKLEQEPAVHEDEPKNKRARQNSS